MEVGTYEPLELKETSNIVFVDSDILALHIRSQNAGLIVRRSSDQYSFESLEVSPTIELSRPGRGNWPQPNGGCQLS
jgi:hypothetical protein